MHCLMWRLYLSLSRTLLILNCIQNSWVAMAAAPKKAVEVKPELMLAPKMRALVMGSVARFNIAVFLMFFAKLSSESSKAASVLLPKSLPVSAMGLNSMCRFGICFTFCIAALVKDLRRDIMFVSLLILVSGWQYIIGFYFMSNIFNWIL